MAIEPGDDDQVRGRERGEHQKVGRDEGLPAAGEGPQPQHGREGRRRGQGGGSGRTAQRAGQPAGREVGRVRRVLGEQPGDVTHAVPPAEVGAEAASGGTRVPPAASSTSSAADARRPRATRTRRDRDDGQADAVLGSGGDRRAAGPSFPARRRASTGATASGWCHERQHGGGRAEGPPPRGRRAGAAIPTAGRRTPSPRCRMRGRGQHEDRERRPRPRRGRPASTAPRAGRTRRRRHEPAPRPAEHVARHEVVDGAVRQAGEQARDEGHPGRPAPAAGTSELDGEDAGRPRLARRRPPPGRAGEGPPRGRPAPSAPPAPVRGGTKTVMLTPRLPVVLHHRLSSTGRRSALSGGGAEPARVPSAWAPNSRLLPMNAVCDRYRAGRGDPGYVRGRVPRRRPGPDRRLARAPGDRQVTRPPTSRPTPGAPPRDHGWR